MIVEDARGKKRSLNGNDSDDEEKLVSLPPVNDIYRMRQQKKVAF